VSYLRSPRIHFAGRFQADTSATPIRSGSPLTGGPVYRYVTQQ